MLRAHIEPLGRKYYGTEVTIVDTLDPNSFAGIEVWVQIGDYEPSHREVELARNSLDMPNATVDEVKAEWICDSHYETKLSLEIAEAIVKYINEERKEA